MDGDLVSNFEPSLDSFEAPVNPLIDQTLINDYTHLWMTASSTTVVNYVPLFIASKKPVSILIWHRCREGPVSCVRSQSALDSVNSDVSKASFANFLRTVSANRC